MGAKRRRTGPQSTPRRPHDGLEGPAAAPQPEPADRDHNLGLAPPRAPSSRWPLWKAWITQGVQRRGEVVGRARDRLPRAPRASPARTTRRGRRASKRPPEVGVRLRNSSSVLCVYFAPGQIRNPRTPLRSTSTTFRAAPVIAGSVVVVERHLRCGGGDIHQAIHQQVDRRGVEIPGGHGRPRVGVASKLLQRAQPGSGPRPGWYAHRGRSPASAAGAAPTA